ncbi:hypothetical protein PN36_25150 [Candidatus Thiomargarita nelsonii]|uniref:Uncharacterized protein n=1 Tax=Candidatus Thiomargarita nelsonii TaxID=1003181 RepID=A0A0A6P2L5_9GAMM|nr:hypothetical protein PN36_25150 [Candidatus Thiomargarita nelsonii]
MIVGWNNHTQHHHIALDDNTFTLSSIAEKHGVQILICTQIPDYLTRKQIEKKVTELVYEHLIIFTDEAQTRQIWQWIARTPHKPTAYREYTYHTGQTGDALIQKLAQIAFTLDEEEALTFTTVTKKLKDTFDIKDCPYTRPYTRPYANGIDLWIGGIFVCSFGYFGAIV